ncbi:hydroxyacylglutathione hydrolase [Cognatiyoonia sediminum]|uniref:Hydroxyacylglutathione hydrolase n=1 Tax=Cognatiyoonia sediminum TaxID=1508389 RepID=A0A1M5NTH2_9RHOB|nr:hydroxyacylglutathione hydrolase [Cognatiyoonia sediminum]SHG92866.1 hydroxyacylglutathione hydrolase [Cognatiyoonia sediminum]
MPLELVTIPCLEDNYAYLLHNAETGETALVDAPEPGPIQAELDKRGWALTDIILTHHHWDHIDGLEPLRGNARVIGAAADAHRLPELDLPVAEGDTPTVLGESVQIFDVSGHTIGHIAIYFPEAGVAFTADSLMAMGCGRLFEGTPEQMWNSMLKLRTLPSETIIASGHEYTLGNANFAASLGETNNAVAERIGDVQTARATGQTTVPTTLALECATNPFLRADDPALKSAIGLPNGNDVDVFTEIRSRKDKF